MYNCLNSLQLLVSIDEQVVNFLFSVFVVIHSENGKPSYAENINRVYLIYTQFIPL